MEHHKTLYKDQRLHTPRQHNRLNRELQEANRNKRRRDQFQDARNISLSPICMKKEIVIPLCTEENENINTSPQQNINSTRLAKIVCSSSNSEKLSKQEAFLKRFVEWKEDKKNMKNAEALIRKKKPFVSAVSGSTQTASSSLVPRGHHKGFRPPIGLENPVKEKAENKSSTVKGRPSTYIVVPTPPRKQMTEKCANKYPITRKALLSHNFSTNKNADGEANIVNTASKIKTSKLCNKTPGDTKSLLRKSPSSTAKTTAVKIIKAIERAKRHTPSAMAQTTRRKDIRTCDLKMPPPKQPVRAVTVAPSKQTGAIAKIKKKTEDSKQFDKSSKTGRACLSQNLKAKKTINNKKANIPTLNINGKNLLNITNNHTDDDMVIQTPKDFAAVYSFDKFVTSTKIKNTSQSKGNGGISEIEALHKISNSSSVKRNIMEGTTNVFLSDRNVEKNLPKREKKYNFIRYSEKETVNKMQDGKENINDLLEKTPTKCGPEERPANYLSPYVSVTRGKVSLKTEKEKRNSIYLQNASQPNASAKELITQNTSKHSVEVRRTLEAVRYFRKQLQDEIERLHQLCDIWENYKQENFEKIQYANGEDMINVTIGQTRLLTSKKFMQFKGLIDRCEAGATSMIDIGNDGSEDAKPVTSGDLEGFWSMLGIQIDNLEKRFDNLNRWKNNDWEDPDEKKVEINKKFTKIKKNKAIPVVKAKPSSALQQMIRKMQSDMRKNKDKINDHNDVVVFTSKTNQQRSANSSNTTPRQSGDTSSTRRHSITVKDRKYFSPAATVISVCSPNPMKFKSSEDSPKIVKHIQKFDMALDSMQCLRKSVLINKNLRRTSVNSISPATKVGNSDHTSNTTILCSNHKLSSPESPHHSPVSTGRKSILKTPGTAKSRLRKVIFNEKLRVKKFNFLINGDGTSFNTGNKEDTQEEDLSKSYEVEIQNNDNPQRTLTLRNRKVRMRPSSEIVIPKK